MSKFSAINLSDDEADLDEHTRELQIEESLKLFKEALNFQKDHDFQNATDVYEALFKIDVISDFSPSTTAVSNLRYLSYRNRGFLKFEVLLKRQKDTVADDSIGEDFLDDLYDDAMSCIEDLVTALLFGEGDTKLIELIYQFFQFFGNDRLTRFIIEYELMKNDITTGNESNLLVIRRNKVSSTFSKFLSRYKALLTKLNDLDSTLAADGTFIKRNKIDLTQAIYDETSPRDLTFLQPLKDEIAANQYKNLKVPRTVEIDLSKYQPSEIKISTILKEIQHVLPRPKSRLKRFYDHYYSTDDPIEVVSMNLPEEVEENAEAIPNSEDIEIIEYPSNDQRDSDNDEHIVEILEESKNDSGSEPSGTKEEEAKKAEETEKERKRSSRRLNPNQAVEEPVKITELDYTYQEKFLASIESFISQLGLEESEEEAYHLEDMVDSMKDQSFSYNDMHLNDFIKILDCWNVQKSELLLLNVENNKKNISIMEILNATSFNDFAPIESKDIDSYKISDLISSINSSKSHYHALRIMVLEFILELKKDSNDSLIINYKMDQTSFQNLKHFIDCSDILLYTKIKDSLNSEINVGVTVSVFEILVDAYIAIYAELELNKNADKHKAASIELLSQQKILSCRIERWKALAEDLLFIHKETKPSLYLRFEWCDLTYLQHQVDLSSSNEMSIKKRLSILLQHKSLKNTNIDYLNYNFIKKLSYENVNVQLSKMNILTTFSNIFKDDSGIDNSEKINLLEKILFPENSKDRPKEQKDMEEFVKSSTLELKLKLFQVLLDYFRKTSNLEKYQTCIEHLIDLLHSKITSKDYKKHNSFVRQQELLRIYAFYGEFIANYVATLSENRWQTANTPHKKETFQKLFEFFRIGYLFCLHEDIAVLTTLKLSIKSKSVRSFGKLKDILTSTFTLFFIYYEALYEQKDPRKINEFLDLLHDQLGCRKYCEAADGKFLKLLEDTLVNLGWSESEKDILQVISCRYKLQISVDGFTPANHETTGIPFDKANALEIAKFVLPICFKKRNPILNNIKADVKVLLDSIYEAIGDPDESNESVARCTALLEEFLDNTPLDVRVMRDLFYGLGSLDLKPSKMDIQQAIDNGLYYIQGTNALNLFKVRKRSMQSRISELDFVIKMLKQDLLCGSNRLESWFLLGQTYGYLVEDDLIWTSDKLTNEDKKESTALLQKKSLLCYLMAINQYALIPDKKNLEHISAIIWSSFGKELYNASMDPMSRLCFNVNGIPKYFKRRTKIFEKNWTNPISEKTLLRLLISSFKMASKLDGNDWLNFYYLAKSEHKIGNDPPLVFECLLKACQLAKSAGTHADPVIEPHYLLCSLAFKMVFKDHISVDDAIGYLSKNSMLKLKRDDQIVETKLSFALLVIDCLKQICSLDKKNWHHKPHYRIARIQMSVFHDIDAARQEMLTLINLKPTVKNLVTIWKPEFERPGKHFTYNYQYVMFFTDILFEAEDLTSLLSLGRKLRRFGASMVNLLKAWGHATKKICDLSRKYAGIDPSFSEKCIATIIYGEFMVKAKEFNSYLNGRHGEFDNEKHQELLYLFTEFAEIKRMSNGFSQTAYIDDTFYCLYLKLYFIYRNEIDQNKQQVNVEDAVKSKLAKRDIAEVIKSLNLPKLPEKALVYAMPEPKIEIEIDDQKDDEVTPKIAVPKNRSPQEKELIVVDEEEKPNFSISILSMLKNKDPEKYEVIDDQEGSEVATPEKNKRAISVSETPKKRLKLDEEVASEDDVFVTPKKNFDDNDDIDDNDDVVLLD